MTMKKLDEMDLSKVSGGNAGANPYAWDRVMANVPSGTVPLQASPVDGDPDVIAQIPNGFNFLVTYDQEDGNYVMADYNGQIGWVRRDKFVSLKGGIGRS
jgi:hypothetical protein